MTDPALEAIRQKRLAELANGEDSTAGLPSSVISQLGNQNTSPSENEAKKAESEEIRRTAVTQIIDSEARERLSRIALVRPQRARQIEDMLLRMAQTGQLKGRVTEDQLIGVLDQLEQAESGSTKSSNNSTKITYVRKGIVDDDDWDL